jgi:hypothetical protein
MSVLASFASFAPPRCRRAILLRLPDLPRTRTHARLRRLRTRTEQATASMYRTANMLDHERGGMTWPAHNWLCVCAHTHTSRRMPPPTAPLPPTVAFGADGGGARCAENARVKRRATLHQRAAADLPPHIGCKPVHTCVRACDKARCARTSSRWQMGAEPRAATKTAPAAISSPLLLARDCTSWLQLISTMPAGRTGAISLFQNSVNRHPTLNFRKTQFLQHSILQYLTIRFPSAKMTYYGLRISEYRACTFCLQRVNHGAAAPVSGRRV